MYDIPSDHFLDPSSDGETPAELALADTRALFRSMVMDSPIPTQIHGTDGILEEVNRAWEDLWALPAREAVGRFNILQDAQARDLGIEAIFRRVLEGRSMRLPDYEYDPTVAGAKGRKHWLRSRLFPLKDKDNQVRKVVITHEDITLCKLNEERYHILLENVNEAIMVFQDGLIRFFNPKALAIAGYSDMGDFIGKPFVTFVHPDCRAELIRNHERRVRGEEVPSFYKTKIVHRDGRVLWLQLNVIMVDWEGRPASLAFLYDITEQKKAEEELESYKRALEQQVAQRTSELTAACLELQEARDELEKRVRERTRELEEANLLLQREIAERQKAEETRRELEARTLAQSKLASLGELSASIAHEINQPLSYIKLIFDCSVRDLSKKKYDEAEMLDDFRLALVQVHRITRIVDQLRTFCRKDPNIFQSVLPTESIDKTLVLLGERLKLQGVALNLTTPKRICGVHANPVMLDQLFINLIINSLDALEGKKDGRIDIAIRRYRKQVQIRFADNGCGIEPAIRDQIFSPFFTTKDKGKGTGLGLAIVKGIVQEHKGTIKVDSRPGRGTTFTITLPGDD